MKKIIYCLPLVLLVFSCKKTEMSPIVEPGEIKISVSSAEVRNATKAKSTDGFVEDSEIGIFSAVDHLSYPLPVLDDKTAKDYNYVYRADKNSTFWTAVAGPIFFDPYKNITLYSYYPYSGQLGSPNTIELTSTGYVVNYTARMTQNTDADLQFSDLMYAKCGEVSNINTNVMLPFQHKLAKLRFALMKSSDWGAMPVKLSSIKVSGANIYTQALMSLIDGGLTPVANDKVNTVEWNATVGSEIVLNSITTYDIDLIIIPTKAAGTVVTFVANDKEFEYVVSAEGNFEAATNHIYKVTIMPAGASAPIEVVPSIVDWEVNSGIVIRPK